MIKRLAETMKMHSNVDVVTVLLFCVWLLCVKFDLFLHRLVFSFAIADMVAYFRSSYIIFLSSTMVYFIFNSTILYFIFSF